MEIFIIIYSIVSTLLFLFLFWVVYKLNDYIGNLETELDEVSEELSDTKKVLEEAIKEDYLEKSPDNKKTRIKKPLVSKNEMN